MYLHSPSAPSLDTGNHIKAHKGGDLAQRLWKQVRAAFPDQRGTSFRLEQGGGDHLLLIVDASRAYRFPRPGTHGLDLEIKVLEQLRHHARIAVPAYDLIDPDGCFASYLLIAGSPLTPTRFSRLPGKTAQAAVVGAVMLLGLLHELNPDAIEPTGTWPRMWSSARFADRIEANRLPLLMEQTPTLAGPITNFLNHYRDDRAPGEVILHGDLVSDHLLVDEHTGRLAGIIDFSDVALGDPAQDFLGFWAYGASAVGHAVAGYDAGCLDRTLLARSYNHFVRHRIDRLYEMITDGAPAQALDRNAAALQHLLAAPPRS